MFLLPSLIICGSQLFLDEVQTFFRRPLNIAVLTGVLAHGLSCTSLCPASPEVWLALVGLLLSLR